MTGRLADIAPRLVAVAAIAAVPLVPGMPDFWVTLGGYIGLYSLVAIGLVLLTGVGGMTSFGQAAFVGFGAYATAVMTSKLGFSPWATLPFALAATGSIALLIGLVTVKLSGHYLPLGTIAWGISFFYLFGNIEWLGRHDGISGLPPFAIGPVSLIDARAVYFLIWLLVLVAVVLSENLLDSRMGRAIRALRGGSVAAESFGVDTARAKLVVFVYAALLAGVSGWLYAHVQRAVSPSPFGLNAGIEYLLMAVLGGSGYVLGGVLGFAGGLGLLVIAVVNAGGASNGPPRIAKAADGNRRCASAIASAAAIRVTALIRSRPRGAIRDARTRAIPAPSRPPSMAAAPARLYASAKRAA